jgi:hypothetical protein
VGQRETDTLWLALPVKVGETLLLPEGVPSGAVMEGLAVEDTLGLAVGVGPRGVRVGATLAVPAAPAPALPVTLAVEVADSVVETLGEGVEEAVRLLLPLLVCVLEGETVVEGVALVEGQEEALLLLLTAPAVGVYLR